MRKRRRWRKGRRRMRMRRGRRRMRRRRKIQSDCHDTARIE